MNLLESLERQRTAEHFGRAEFYEQTQTHVVGEVGEHGGSVPGLLHRGAVHLDEVLHRGNRYFLFRVIDHLRRRLHLAEALVEMNQGHDVVQTGRR